MWRNRFLTLLGAGFLAASAAWADEVGYVDCSNHSEDAQVFGKPRKTPDVVAALPCGERFTIIVYGFYFSRIQTKDGQIGYIYSSLIAVDRGAMAVRQVPPMQMAAEKTQIPSTRALDANLSSATPPQPATAQPAAALAPEIPSPALPSSASVSSGSPRNVPEASATFAQPDPPAPIEPTDAQPQPAPAQPVPTTYSWQSTCAVSFLFFSCSPQATELSETIVPGRGCFAAAEIVANPIAAARMYAFLMVPPCDFSGVCGEQA